MTTQMLAAAGLGRSGVLRAVRAGDLKLVRKGVYAVEPLPPLPRRVVNDGTVSPLYVAHVRAALLALGDGATACGRTAAALRGWGLLVEPTRSIDVAVPHGRGRAKGAGMRIRQRRRVSRQRVEVLAGTQQLWLTSPAATVIDCCLSLPLVEAVVVCDSALRCGHVRYSDLLRAASRLQGVAEARRVRQVLRLADPAAGSVLESVLRCSMVRAGISGFETQRVVRDPRGRRVLRVDFLFERARLVVEVDGAKWHPDPARDRHLDNALAVCGLRVLRYTWTEVVHDRLRVLDEIREALRSATPDIHFGADVTQRAA